MFFIYLFVWPMIFLMMKSCKFKSKRLKYSTASGPASFRTAQPPGNDLNGHSFTMCCIVCCSAPQSQSGMSVKPHLYTSEPHRPVRKRFKRTHQVSDIGKSDSDGNESTLQTGLRETNLSGGMSNIDSYRRDLVFFRQLTNSRTAAASRLSVAGAMFARTGSHCDCRFHSASYHTKSVVQLHIDFAGMYTIQPYWSAVFCISY
jgi:hypothetical protein